MKKVLLYHGQCEYKDWSELVKVRNSIQISIKTSERPAAIKYHRSS